MNISKVLLVLAVLGVTQSAWSQIAEKPKTDGILGYLDARTGAFKPVPLPSPDDEQALAAASITPTTGKFVFNISVNIQSNLPANSVIICGAGANVADVTASFTTIEEQAEVVATRSGSKATCTVTIPYSWPLVSPSQDMVGRSFTISATAQNVVVARQSIHSLAPIKTPANGATTTDTISAVI